MAVLNRFNNQAVRHFLRLCYYVASMNKNVIDRYFYYATVARNGQRILEKTPYHYKFVSEILFSFGAARIFFISRHPVDVYSSFKKRSRIDKSWKDIPISAFCNQYQACYQSILWHLKRRPNNIISLKYENLVQSPEVTFRKVCSFMNEDFEKNCLFGDNSIEGPEWDPHVHKDIIKKTKSWRDFITSEEAEEIEISVADIMSTFQYESYTKK